MSVKGTVLFANGFEFRAWRAANCDGCARSYDETSGRYRCDLEKAIDEASWTTGEVSDEVLHRLGWKEDNRFMLGWSCAERQPVEQEVTR